MLLSEIAKRLKDTNRRPLAIQKLICSQSLEGRSQLDRRSEKRVIIGFFPSQGP